MNEKHELSGVYRLQTELAEITKLKVEVIELKSQLRLLSQRIGVVLDQKELISLEGERTTVRNELYANDELVSVPIGTIVAFAGTQVPKGWKLCDGVGGPDLNGRFIQGTSDAAANRRTGGARSFRIREEHIPEHSHMYLSYRYSFQSKKAVTAARSFGSDDKEFFLQKSEEMQNREDTGKWGRGQEIEINPPNVQLTYIIKEY